MHWLIVQNRFPVTNSALWIRPAAVITVAVLCSAFLTSCATQGHKRSTKTGLQLQAVGDQAARTSLQLEQTVAALSSLVQNPQADLRPQYKSYDRELSRLESSASRLAKARVDSAAKMKTFLAHWDKEIALIQNPNIRALTQERKEALAQRFEAARRSYTNAETALNPMLANFQDLQRVLSVDLTPTGVAVLQNPVAKANVELTTTRQILESVALEFRELGSAMTAFEESQTRTELQE